MASSDAPSPEHGRRKVWVINIVHPDEVVRGAWAAEPQQHEYLRRARALAGGSWRPPAHDALIEHILLNPTLDQLTDWAAQVQAAGLPLAVDIECAGPHLVCVGFAQLDGKGGAVVRFRGPGGKVLWGDQLRRAVELTYSVLANPHVPKWFHNGQAFDIPYLTYQGFKVDGFAGDTLLLQRYMFPEMEATLQSCGTFYLGVPAWKWLASENNDDESGDGK